MTREINRAVLTAEENLQLGRLEAGTFNGVSLRSMTRAQWRGAKIVHIVGVVWFLAILDCVAIVILEGSTSRSLSGATVFYLFVIGLLAPIVVILLMLETAPALKKSLIDDYLVQIDYLEREKSYAPPPPEPAADYSDGRSHYPITGHYDPERYFSYSGQQRETMKVLGIDADTYDANVDGAEHNS